MKSLRVIKGLTYVPAMQVGPSTIDFEELKTRARSGRLLGSILQYQDVRLQTQRLETLTKPLATAILLRALSRGTCQIEDATGQTQVVGPSVLLELARSYVVDRRDLGAMVRNAEEEVARLAADGGAQARPLRDFAGTPVYLRSDHIFGVEAGGSVGHIAGVVNNLRHFTGSPLFVTTDSIPTVNEAIETEVVLPSARFRDFVDAPLLAFNQRFFPAASRAVGSRAVAFVYQRYSAYNYTGAALARHLQVPFVLEYNGSEVWVNRHWGRRLHYEDLAGRIELLNLRAASMVVAVSDVIRDELVSRGIEARKVLSNANGVDPETYSPVVDGRPVRARLGIEPDYVVGFIGTFGRWHGAENLAAAFSRLLDQHPELSHRVRLIMIGDGVGLPATRKIIDEGRHKERVIFTGRVPQVEGPAYLAACDLLVSPHVPNPDGSRFFGSPTKLFEYMAMGKPIVASSLEQIADILEDGRTAVMVEPGNVDDLVRGIKTVIDSPELGARLGAAARRQAVERHTWREHTRRIIERLEELCA